MARRDRRSGILAPRPRGRRPPRNGGNTPGGRCVDPRSRHGRPGRRAAFRDRRCAPAFLGSFEPLLPVAQRRAADPVPLRRLPADPPPLPAARLPRRHRAVRSREIGVRRSRVGSARSGRRDATTSRRCAATTGCRASRSRRPGWIVDDAASVLERHAARPFVRSVRHKPRANRTPGNPAPGGMTDRAWRAGFAELARRELRFDLQTPWWHLREAARLAGDFPATHDHPEPHRPAGRPQRPTASPAGSAR